MVYCGKASQGCQNCRVRRIKCDKIRPECSQCIRVGKQCPGYRDQLSLMFRDESTKVMQRAHAQWGGEPGDSSSAPSSAGSGRTASPTDLTMSTDASSVSPVSPKDANSAGTATPPTVSPLAARKAARRAAAAHSVKQEPSSEQQPTSELAPEAGAMVVARGSMPHALDPALIDQGVNFYIERFVLPQPDMLIPPDKVMESPFTQNPVVKELMAAIGLAALSNLRGDASLNVVAREKYGSALMRTMRSVGVADKTEAPPVMRSVVMLAVFEVVKATHESNSSAMMHIRGAAAFMGKFLSKITGPNIAFRGLVQLCYSLFIPCQIAGVPLPSIFFESIAIAKKSPTAFSDDERPSMELIVIITRLVHFSAALRSHAFTDGRPRTGAAIRQALAMENDLQAWEQRQEGIWPFEVLTPDPPLPAEAVFGNRLHAYTNQSVGRVWNHYRWACILANELIIDLAHRFPASSLPLVSAARQARCLATVRRLAEDVLVSIPTHWRHPVLTAEQCAVVERASGGLTIGVAGIPGLLHQVKAAACAPGVPVEFWRWGLAVLDTVWAEMGMLQARSLAEAVRAHRDKLKMEEPDGLLKRSPHVKREVVPAY